MMLPLLATLARRYYPTIVGVTILIHVLWATGLFLEPSAALTTPTHLMLVLVTMVVPTVASPTLATSAVFAMVAIAAAIGLCQRDRRWEILLILPQHFALWVSSIGAVHAMYIGQYADGVPRPNWFLIVDQAPIVAVALGHLVALLFIAAQRGSHSDGRR